MRSFASVAVSLDLCIKSYAAAVTGLPVGEVQPDTLPIEWFGNVEDTHKAIDDAVGFANLRTVTSCRHREKARSSAMTASSPSAHSSGVIDRLDVPSTRADLCSSRTCGTWPAS